ncbi:MAG: YjjG family noncanonical pyrimidine nucleotidase [Eubacterium sp.]|nr:YjjG family noncanonical pyrimidine nucleotidase [Eubacterium sp.]
MIKVIFWDLDNTVLDFLLAEKNSLKAAFKALNLGQCTDEMVKTYSSINVKHWEMLERGEIKKKDVYRLRFIEFLKVIGKDADPLELNEYYERGICDTISFIENSYDIVASLRGKYKQYCVTNGRKDVQLDRLKISRLDKLFDGVFISDIIGYEKPSKEFFDYVLKQIIPCEKDEILIIGDSLTSDIRGGNNANIKCCWYNPNEKTKPDDIRIDYEIKSLTEIKSVLKEEEL